MSAQRDSSDDPDGRPPHQRIKPRCLSRFREIPNLLTLLRLLAIPPLWIFAALNQPHFIGYGVLFAGITDLLDGYAARRLAQVSEFGQWLDWLSDNLLLCSVVAWILMLKPEVFGNHPYLILIWGGVNLASLVIGRVKFGRFASRPIYSIKAATILGYGFVFHLFAVGYSEGLFFITIAALILASAEAFLIQLAASNEARRGVVKPTILTRP